MIRANDPVVSAPQTAQVAPTLDVAAPAPAVQAPEADQTSALQSTSTVSVEAARSNVADKKAELKDTIASAGDSTLQTVDGGAQPAAQTTVAGVADGGADSPTAADGTPPTDGAQQTGQTAAATSQNGAKPSDTESYRKLIAADIKSAYGREATDKDYDYWLGKLQGPNDSSFVTSGSMNATEYWHRRMLGWQAGGSDVATAGPYAGGGGPHGDVQPATDIVPSVPPGGVYNQASPERIADLKNVINSDLQTAYGRPANDQDYGYWLNKFLGPCDSGYVTSGNMKSDEYWHRRLLGWQAGGADIATSGPYAGSGDDAGRPIPSVDSLIAAFRASQGSTFG